MATQLAHLRDKLTGNLAFKECRGRFGDAFDRIVQDLMPDEGNPSKFRRDFEKLSSASTVMTSLLAFYRYNGWERAYDELQEALKDGSHVVTGESFSDEETVPMTVIMFAPQITLRILHWLHTERLADLNRFIKKAECDKDEASEATNQLHMDYRNLYSLSRDRLERNGGEGEELFTLLEQETRHLPKEFEPAQSLRIANRHQIVRTSDRRGSTVPFEKPVAYLFPRRDKRSVAHMFTESGRKKMAMWQFNLPHRLTHGSGCPIIIQPESERSYWMNILPGNVSADVIHGFGMLAKTYSFHHDIEMELLAEMNDHPRILLETIAKC